MTRIQLAITLVCAAVLPAVAQDPVKLSPEQYKVEAENELARVLRIKRGAHGKVPLHEHPAAVAVFLTDAHLRVTGADGKVQEATRKTGEVVFNNPSKHAEENLSDRPMETILIELKSPATPAGTELTPLALDPPKLDPKHFKVELENDRVRIMRVQRGPHEGSPLHEHRSFAVVFIRNVYQRVTDGEGRARETTRKAGDVALNRPTKHQELNLTDQPTESVLVEFKFGAAPAR